MNNQRHLVYLWPAILLAFLVCAKHVQQLGGESPLPSLMETKG